ncbi:unnamed protein product, partial [Pylaiella littoralis]
SRLKKAATRSRPSVWCELLQLQARRLILKVGLGRDLVPRDLPTAKNPNRLCETLTSMLKAPCVRGWKVTKSISEGSFGHVFRALRNDGTRAVIKVRLVPRRK